MLKNLPKIFKRNTFLSALACKAPFWWLFGAKTFQKSVSFEVRIDSFQETFKNTKVRTIVKTAALSTMSKGMGKSPTFIIP